MQARFQEMTYKQENKKADTTDIANGFRSRQKEKCKRKQERLGCVNSLNSFKDLYKWKSVGQQFTNQINLNLNGDLTAESCIDWQCSLKLVSCYNAHTFISAIFYIKIQRFTYINTYGIISKCILDVYG